MDIGLFTTFMSPVCTAGMIQDFARRIEAVGIESLWLGEHVVLFDEMEFPYPGSRDGRIPVPAGGGLLDTVGTIGFMAACTERLRFGTGITLLPQRNPVYTAKEFATLDWLSGGRLDFGVGIGWCKEEVIACGYSFHDRGERCDEFLQVVRQLWTREYASFSGRHFQLPECRMDPKPVQRPHPPVIIGGHSQAGLRRAARFGDGWYGFQLDPAQTEAVRVRLEKALAAEGRTFADFTFIITPPYETTPGQVADYRALGVTQLAVHLGGQKPAQVDARIPQLEEFVAAAQ